MYQMGLRRKDHYFWAYKAALIVRRSSFIGDEYQPRNVGGSASASYMPELHLN